MEGIFINLDDPYNRWELDTIRDIISLVKLYVVSHKLKDVELCRVEDNRWEDQANKRFDVIIRYKENNHMFEQHLLILKGQIIDGKEFHERHDEFYPRKEKYEYKDK